MSSEIAIEGVYRDLFDKTEWVGIVTSDGKTPHLAANWGDYLRAFGILEGNTLVMPAGRYQQTEENLRRNPTVQLMMASRQVQGSRTPGQGCLLVGEGHIQSEGPLFQRVKEKFPWARGALVIRIKEMSTQL